MVKLDNTANKRDIKNPSPLQTGLDTSHVLSTLLQRCSSRAFSTLSWPSIFSCHSILWGAGLGWCSFGATRSISSRTSFASSVIFKSQTSLDPAANKSAKRGAARKKKKEIIFTLVAFLATVFLFPACLCDALVRLVFYHRHFGFFTIIMDHGGTWLVLASTSLHWLKWPFFLTLLSNRKCHPRSPY